MKNFRAFIQTENRIVSSLNLSERYNANEFSSRDKTAKNSGGHLGQGE